MVKSPQFIAATFSFYKIISFTVWKIIEGAHIL